MPEIRYAEGVSTNLSQDSLDIETDIQRDRVIHSDTDRDIERERKRERERERERGGTC